MPRQHVALLHALTLCACAALPAQVLQNPYSNVYSFASLGAVPGVPSSYGGLAFRTLEPGALYIMGGANGASGRLYRIGVVRDASKHITMFWGTATPVAAAPGNDGGLQFGPGDVAFYTRYPSNELGQIKRGSVATDKVVGLTALGIASSVGALSFVPAGYPGTGRLKLASYNANTFYTTTLSPDANGTYDLSPPVRGTTIQGGVEGFLYLAPGSPLFTDFRSMLVCEYGTGGIFAYDLDPNGDPDPTTRRAFVLGVAGPQGAAIDPLTGDFVFTTYGGAGAVLVVRGFGLPCGALMHYGQGTPGTGNQVPVLGGEGCFARNQTVNMRVSNGKPGAFGIMVFGLQQQALPLLGITMLVVPIAGFPHALDGTGVWALGITVPNDGNLLGTDFYFQSACFDTGALMGISATGGVKVQVR